jgi:hypothetical protein
MVKESGHEFKQQQKSKTYGQKQMCMKVTKMSRRGAKQHVSQKQMDNNQMCMTALNKSTLRKHTHQTHVLIKRIVDIQDLTLAARRVSERGDEAGTVVVVHVHLRRAVPAAPNRRVVELGLVAAETCQDFG